MRARRKPEAAPEPPSSPPPDRARRPRLPAELPLLPLRDTVLFPGTTLPLFAGRPASVAALDAASRGDRLLLAVAQRRPETPDPGREELYRVGTVARLLQLFRLPDGTRRALVEGLEAAQVAGVRARKPYPLATASAWPDAGSRSAETGLTLTEVPPEEPAEAAGASGSGGPEGPPRVPRGARACGGRAAGASGSGGPEGPPRVLQRARPRASEDCLSAGPSGPPDPTTTELTTIVRDAFRRYVELDPSIPREALLAVAGAPGPAELAGRVAGHLRAPVSVRQRLLECPSPGRRLALLTRILGGEIARLSERVRPARPEPAACGTGDFQSAAAPRGEEPRRGDELAELAASIEAAGLPEAVAERARRELERLGRTSSFSPEAAVSRHYLEWLNDLPWHRASADCVDLARARRILDEDHFGLDRVKERILELISVIRLCGEARGPILCLAGPPGVGKTSLGRSVARALGRRFARVSLGGVSDEAEIRGHRRTYVGSLPGRILQGMRRAGVVNPVFLLDEIDKLGRDHRGDPAAALLEVLDPEQNGAFNDHYLEVDYDLSRVLFLTTANLLDAIPEPLRDRLEIIRLPGYLEAEKLQIARGYLAPRQLEANGLRTGDLELPDETILRLIRGYTREAGVRGLERQIARVCRRTALHKAGGREAAFGDARPPRGRRALGLRVEPAQLDGLLGAAPHAERAQPAERSGVATGLAWTESGGEVLSVECSALPGRGRLLLTGKLGATMRESARAALTFVRSRAGALGIDPNFQRHMDIHIHIPEGAIPKDGPSAGVTMALALASALTGAPTRTRTAMTGEITLRGRVLPVGGLAEKLVAARRAGVEQVFLPRANEPQLLELPAQLREGLALRLVETMDQILEGALEAPGAPAEGAAGDLDPGRARAA